MITPGLAALIDRGEARVKTFTGTGGVFIIDNPEKAGIVITKIKVHAFADLKNDDPLADDFLAENAAANDVFFNHFLTVKSQKNIDRFHIRHEKNWLLDALNGLSYVIPSGYTEFDCFLKHSDDVVFEMLHAPPVARYVSVVGPVTSNYYMQPPPFGYGNSATGFIPTLEGFSILGGAFGTKPLGRESQTQPPDTQVDTSYYYPNLGSNFLNVPRTNIAFALHTINAVDVQYVSINKQVNETF